MADSAAAPGWYPVGNDTQRYWDGTQWTDNIVPLAISLIKRDESPFVR